MRATCALAVACAVLLAGADGAMKFSVPSKGTGGPQECPGDEVYKACHTSCPRVCGKPDPAGKMCIMSCVDGCGCKNGRLWHHPESHRCFETEEECPGGVFQEEQAEL